MIKYKYKRYHKYYDWEYNNSEGLSIEEVVKVLEKREMVQVKLINT